MKNPYEVLGLTEGCDLSEVKKAYRRMAQKYHPDKSSHPEATEKFKLIREAYDFIRTGKSSTGAFTKASPPPPPKYDPWAASYSIPRVQVPINFSSLFGGTRVQIPKTPFFVFVPAGVQNGSVIKILAETINHSHQAYFDVEFILHDPTGFHQIKKIDGKEVLYSQVRVSSADLLSNVVLYLRNINTNLSDVAVKITPKDKYVKVEEAGLPNIYGKRGYYYVEPIVEFKPLEEERFDTLIALKNKLEETLKSYYSHNRNNF